MLELFLKAFNFIGNRYLIDFDCAILEIHRSLYDRLEERVEKVSRVRSLASLRLARTLSVPLSTKGAMNRANSFEKAFVKGKLFIFFNLYNLRQFRNVLPREVTVKDRNCKG